MKSYLFLCWILIAQIRLHQCSSREREPLECSCTYLNKKKVNLRTFLAKAKPGLDCHWKVSDDRNDRNNYKVYSEWIDLNTENPVQLNQNKPFSRPNYWQNVPHNLQTPEEAYSYWQFTTATPREPVLPLFKQPTSTSSYWQITSPRPINPYLNSKTWNRPQSVQSYWQVTTPRPVVSYQAEKWNGPQSELSYWQVTTPRPVNDILPPKYNRPKPIPHWEDPKPSLPSKVHWLIKQNTNCDLGPWITTPIHCGLSWKKKPYHNRPKQITTKLHEKPIWLPKIYWSDQIPVHPKDHKNNKAKDIAIIPTSMINEYKDLEQYNIDENIENYKDDDGEDDTEYDGESSNEDSKHKSKDDTKDKNKKNKTKNDKKAKNKEGSKDEEEKMEEIFNDDSMEKTNAETKNSMSEETTTDDTGISIEYSTLDDTIDSSSTEKVNITNYENLNDTKDYDNTEDESKNDDTNKINDNSNKDDIDTKIDEKYDTDYINGIKSDLKIPSDINIGDTDESVEDIASSLIETRRNRKDRYDSQRGRKARRRNYRSYLQVKKIN